MVETLKQRELEHLSWRRCCLCSQWCAKLQPGLRGFLACVPIATCFLHFSFFTALNCLKFKYCSTRYSSMTPIYYLTTLAGTPKKIKLLQSVYDIQYSTAVVIVISRHWERGIVRFRYWSIVPVINISVCSSCFPILCYHIRGLCITICLLFLMTKSVSIQTLVRQREWRNDNSTKFSGIKCGHPGRDYATKLNYKYKERSTRIFDIHLKSENYF